jgi:hypothetical protein
MNPPNFVAIVQRFVPRTIEARSYAARDFCKYRTTSVGCQYAYRH